ncbi:hypothetical protein OsI_05933 [Oryza sativa Indica Group]|uniref:Uncharacterized protein n=1 Tax=Oryza sativa subsp. indica TaxID=39946 RepID=B8AI59_ORYSI|nr:hypothetical protein OsI_05933 [Oryza sativa Indica Group]
MAACTPYPPRPVDRSTCSSLDPPAPRSRPLCSAFLIQFRRQAGAAAHAAVTSTAEGSASVLVTPASSPALGRPNNSRFRPNIETIKKSATPTSPICEKKSRNPTEERIGGNKIPEAMKLSLISDGDIPDSQDDQGSGGRADGRQVLERGGGGGKRRIRVFLEEEDEEENAMKVDEEAVILSCARGGPAGVSTAKIDGCIDKQEKLKDAVLHAQDGQGSSKQRKKSCSTVMKLQFREIGLHCSLRTCGISRFVPTPSTFSHEVFSKIKNNKVVFDIYRCKDVIRHLERPIRKRSAVLQILPLKDLVAVVLCSGLSFLLSRVTNKMISILNRYDDEIIVYIFYNKEDKSVITTSSRLFDGCMSRQVTSTPLECIRSNKQNNGQQIFESENIKWPDSVDFDAPNARALIQQRSTYRVFDLKDYSLLYQIPDVNVHQVVFRPSLFLIKLEQTHNVYPFRIFCAQNFEETHSFVLVASSKRPDIQPLHDKMIIKQNFANENGNLQILDLRSSKITEVPIGIYEFHALHGRNLFLSFQNNSTELRDLQGDIVRNFEDHVLDELNCVDDKLFITKDEDVIISGCKSEGIGAVHISSIESGKCITDINTKVIVSALSYNPELNEIFIGTAKGKVQALADLDILPHQIPQKLKSPNKDS